MSLTERVVRDAKPDGKARTIWDKQVMGLGLQITPKGVKNYVIRYRVGDRKRQAILARAGQISLKDARERAGTELVRIRAGEVDPLQRRRVARVAPTMAEFIDQFFAVEVPARIARGRMKPITAETYGYQSRTHVLPVIGTRRVADVTRADIERMVAPLPGPSRNRVLALASRLFTLAETWELRAPGSNPARKIERAREEARDRVLSPSELSALARISHEYGVHRGSAREKVLLQQRLHRLQRSSPMPAECSPPAMQFARLNGRDVVADFGGGVMTSDAGALLLGATDRAIGLVDCFAACFSDGRAASRVVHDVATLVGQRVFGIALGYEDLIDHDALRHDPVLGVVLGRLEAGRAGCAPLAGKSTLNRLEHAPSGAHRYRRIGHEPEAIETLFVDLFLDAHGQAPERLILDLDATDDPLHGHQEGRFFHGYYDCYCYLPLYVFCGDHLLAAKLRRADIDASAGAAEEVARIVARIRARWPAVEIVLRADSGFAREGLMAWCEANGVDYVFGLARNPRLTDRLQPALDLAEARSRESGQPARLFTEFRYRTCKTWSRPRRVVGKAEWMPGRANPRFVVTSLSAAAIDRRELYETLYCARGDMENRIKECQLDLFADRTSAQTMRANQLRLWFAAMAYVLLAALRRIALAGTRLARATCGSIRLKLLKIGAQVRLSTRRIRIAMASGAPHAPEFARAHARLCT